MLMIERKDLETNTIESVITLDEAIEKLVPAYYMDRELVEHALVNGQPVRTTAFEYRRVKSQPTVVATLKF
jgi:hypothetical protein